MEDTGWRKNTKTGGWFNIYDIEDKTTNKYMNEKIRNEALKNKMNPLDHFSINEEGVLRKKEENDTQFQKYLDEVTNDMYENANYTNEEINEFGLYFGNLNFRKVNDYLRNGKDQDINGIKASSLANKINNKINTVNTNRDLTLYRGYTNYDTEQASKLRVGDVVIDKGILSTSLNPERAYEVAQSATLKNNKPVMFEIETKRGTNALISSKSKIKNEFQENEVVLPSNTSLRIKEINDYKYVKLIKATIE